ncbi:MAG: phosphoribosyl-ATP diphosphatase [Burkholderiaceae bacterium]|jgi:phosphoribosyl-ATP pyrophosphohydrolase|nr:phosphoribosyl-ATP diphosphatase [Burkholderiaceae bacterium]
MTEKSSPRSATAGDVLARLAEVVASRKGADPERSYVARLFAKGPDAVLKKIGEEATETVMAAKDGVAQRIVSETADLWFHCIVMLAQHGLAPSDVLDELARREGLSGLDEKASRARPPADGAKPAAQRGDE